MRSPVYRNLDRAFQILGFSPFELTGLVIAFIVLGELAQASGISRLWSFLATSLFALGLYWFRRIMGDRFAIRLFRFLLLPSEVCARLMRIKGE